jgi:hypothetical protein
MRSFRVLLLVSLAGSTLAPARAQCLVFSNVGATSDNRFGTTLAAFGDIDLDGVGELAAASFPCGVGCGMAEARFLAGDTGQMLNRVGNPSIFFGNLLTGIGDVDQDGHGDLVIGHWAELTAYSGRSAAPLYSFRGPHASNMQSVANLGDLDGDLIPELAVGDIGANRVWVLSGADGALRFFLEPNPATCTFGRSVAGLGDVSGDGIPDILVGSNRTNLNFPNVGGAVWLFSGRDGSLIYFRSSAAAVEGLGWSVAGMGDIDGDQVPDFAAGGLMALSSCFSGSIYGEFGTAQFYGPGLVRVYSGATGTVLFEHYGLQLSDQFGIRVAGGGDFDADGVPDLAVGANQFPNGGQGGYVRVFSGATGQLLKHFGAQPGDFFMGQSLAFLPDFDGDGSSELAIGIPGRTIDGVPFAGAVEVYRGNCWP